MTVLAPTTAQTKAPSNSRFKGMSTATEAQYERLLPLLRLRPHHTMELRRAGIMMPAARIKELNDRYGFNIKRIDSITLWDEWGFSHTRIAVYELFGEPDAEQETGG